MGWIAEEAETYRLHNPADAGAIVNLVSESHSASHAVELFGQHLSQASCNLVYLADFDAKGVTDSNQIWSTLPPELEKLRNQFDSKTGCPLTQLAMKNGVAIEALEFYMTGFEEFIGAKYLKALNELGYHHLAVIPVNAGSRSFVSFIGLHGRLFNGGFREHLCLSVAAFTAALFSRYPLLRSSIVQNKRATSYSLSKREKECLAWSAQGKTSYEISIILKLSEHTINNYISNACRRLDAANKSHAVAKAIQSGVIESSSLF